MKEKVRSNKTLLVFQKQMRSWIMSNLTKAKTFSFNSNQTNQAKGNINRKSRQIHKNIKKFRQLVILLILTQECNKKNEEIVFSITPLQ